LVAGVAFYAGGMMISLYQFSVEQPARTDRIRATSTSPPPSWRCYWAIPWVNHGDDDAAERRGNVYEAGNGLRLCDAEQSSTKFAKRRSLSV
jgi:hypothetical protein